MGQPLRKIIEDYIGIAAASPDPAPVLREAADSFARLAVDPKNAGSSAKLKDMAMEFAAAARRPKRPATISDFEDLLNETHAAVEEVGDEDSLGIIARRSEIHDARSTDAPRVSIAPSSFNDHATLGRMAEIKWNPSQFEQSQEGIAQSQTVAFWQGTKKEAQAMTIDVGLVTPAAPGGGHPVLLAVTPSVRTYAVIDYGSDGDKRSVRLDLALGRRLTVVGNYISVLVGCDPPRLLLAGPPEVRQPTEAVTVGASIGAFAAPSLAPVVSTVIVDGLGSGITSGFLSIPTKAVVLLPMQSNLALGETAIIEWYAYGGGNTHLAQSFYQQMVTAAEPITVPSDAAFFKVTNGGAGAGNFYLPFQLSL